MISYTFVLIINLFFNLNVSQMRQILHFIVVAIIATVFASCEQESISPPSSEVDSDQMNYVMAIDSSLGFTVGVRYNTLCFPTSKDALTALSELPKLSRTERRSWENSIGFTSFQTLYEDVIDRIEADTTRSNFDFIVKKYADIVSVDPSQPYTVKSRVYGNYPCITNNLGYFSNEVFTNKVMDGNMYTALYKLLPAVEAKYCETVYGKKFEGLEKFNVQVLQLEDNVAKQEKSAVVIAKSSEQLIEINLGNKVDDTDWTRKAYFKIELLNSYVCGTLSYREDFFNYYFVVYYFSGLDPNAYGYYGSYFDGSPEWRKFIHIYGENNGDDYWKIQVPSEGYFNGTYLGERPPLGDVEKYVRQYVGSNSYYKYSGDIIAHLYYNIRSRKKSSWEWQCNKDEKASMYNFDVDVKIQHQNRYGTDEFLDESNEGYCNPAKTARLECDGWIHVYSLIFEEAKHKPTASFKNVHGVLYYENYDGLNHEYFLNRSF